MTARQVLRGLAAALEARPDGAALEVLGRFAARPQVRVAPDDGSVAKLVSERWAQVTELLASPDAGTRHAAAWAIGRSGDPRGVPLLVDLLESQRDHFDHDYAYAAAKDLGPAGLRAFAKIALEGTRGRREHALQCLGQSRLGARVVPILRSVAARHGPSRALYNAVHNLHAAGALALVLPGLAARSAEARLDAMGAVMSCLEDHASRGTTLPVAKRRVATALERVFVDRRMWASDDDPWASLFAWGLESLAFLRAPEGRRLALRGLSYDPDRRRTALDVLRVYRADAGVEAAALPWLDAESPEDALRAALVLRGPRSAAMLLEAMTGADDSPCWYRIVDDAAETGRHVAAWLRAAGRAGRGSAAVRRRVARAVVRVANVRRGDAWLRRIIARSGKDLARELARAWKD